LAKRLLTALVLYSTIVAAPSAARADDLSQLLVDLIQSDIRLAPPPAGFQSHEAHFLPGSTQQLAPYFFNQQLVLQLATLPLGSPSGGFSYQLNPALGTFTRATDSFGPMFSERAATNGKGRLTVGANFQYSRYNSFEGTNLDNGDIKFYLRHAATGGQFFEGDLIQADLKLDLSSSTTTLFASYGLADRWDVALAVPLQHVSLDAVVDAAVLRLATGANSAIHAFPGGGTTATFTSSGSASGIGDILLRTKYRFASTAGGGMAAGVDFRLPSGDANNLLGTGATQVAFVLIGSSTAGRLSPHFNVGYTASSSGKVVSIPDEFGYRFGAEYVATPKATLSAELIGRTLRDAGRLELGDTVWAYRNSAGVTNSTTLHEFIQQSGSLNLVSLGLGGKVNVGGNFLVTGNVLVALTSAGVTARVTPVVGFSYSF
jgi:hypothetical protein